MDVQTFLMKMGIPTYIYTVETTLQGQSKELIGESIEVSVGHIYGLSINVDLHSNLDVNKLNITEADAPKFFLNLKYGQSIYINGLRLDHLIFSSFGGASMGAGNMYQNQNKYLPVNIPMDTDLKQSYYDNPGKVFAGSVIALNLFYIDLNAYKELVRQGLILVNGKKAGG